MTETSLLSHWQDQKMGYLPVKKINCDMTLTPIYTSFVVQIEINSSVVDFMSGNWLSFFQFIQNSS